MIPGTILFDPEFIFRDGQKGPKLFVLLNDGECGFYVTVNTTSKQGFKGTDYGCQVEDKHPYFFLPEGSCLLEVASWLKLDYFYHIDDVWLANQIAAQYIRQIAVLPDDVLRDLLACVLKCRDLKTKHVPVLEAQLKAMGGPRRHKR